MNEEEKKAIAIFKYWIDTNTEKGVCYLPDYICAKVLNLIEKLQKENEVLKNQEATARKINELLVQRYSNSIPIQKIKDEIEKYKKLSDKFYVKFLESDRYNTDIREKGIKCDAIILALEELIEEREEE